MDGDVVQELCFPTTSLPLRATSKARDAPSAPACEQRSVGTVQHRHPLPRHNVPLCAARPLPPSLPRFPYSRQCHPFPALLGDRGALAGRALLAALAKGKKGQDPGQEAAAGPREMLWVRGSPGSGDPSPESWNGVSTPRAHRVPCCLICAPQRGHRWRNSGNLPPHGYNQVPIPSLVLLPPPSRQSRVSMG